MILDDNSMKDDPTNNNIFKEKQFEIEDASNLYHKSEINFELKKFRDFSF